MLSMQGFQYYAIFVDAYTRYIWLYPLKLKSDLLSGFVTFHKLAENQFQTKIQVLQTDNGGEFRACLPYLQSNGIQPRFTCPHTHKQNGVTERKHKHITKMGLTLLANAKMPLTFLVEAFLTVVHVINLLPSTSVNF